jgi:hypothetical protein
MINDQQFLTGQNDIPYNNPKIWNNVVEKLITTAKHSHIEFGTFGNKRIVYAVPINGIVEYPSTKIITEPIDQDDISTEKKQKTTCIRYYVEHMNPSKYVVDGKGAIKNRYDRGHTKNKKMTTKQIIHDQINDYV